MPSLLIGSLEITLTVPLNKLFFSSNISIGLLKQKNYFDRYSQKIIERPKSYHELALTLKYVNNIQRILYFKRIHFFFK